MPILLDEKTRVLVQGITGREGSARTRFMVEYGTKVVGGVTPGKGGAQVWGVPVYDTVDQAMRARGPIDLSVIFVPGLDVKKAALEAIDAGVRTLVVPAEHVPLHDALEMVAYARRRNGQMVGPGSFGLISPGRAVAGWIGGSEGFAREMFTDGPIGVVSRSGGQTTTICWSLRENGLGVTTAVHTGTEPILGLSLPEYLLLFEEDEATAAVVLFGEIGTVAEEEAAQLILEGKFTKPLVAYVAGGWATSGMRFSHASAIIERGRGSAESKIRALREAGAQVVKRPEDLAPTTARVVKG